MKQPETPFPRHWMYYIALKLVILAFGVIVALSVFGVL